MSEYYIGEPPSDRNPQPQKKSGMVLRDISIEMASGSSQEIAPHDSQRDVLNVTNPDETRSWWINETGGVAAENGVGSFELRAGARWTPRPAPRNAVTAVAETGVGLTIAVG